MPLNSQPEALHPGPWILYPGPWTLDPGPWTLDPGPWTLDPGPWTLDPGPWILDPGTWTLDPGPWTLKLEKLHLRKRIDLSLLAQQNLLQKCSTITCMVHSCYNVYFQKTSVKKRPFEGHPRERFQELGTFLEPCSGHLSPTVDTFTTI